MQSRRATTNTRRRPTQSRAIETRQRLVDAALWILVHEGVDAVTTRAVAERAKVSVGAIYEYFASLDAIWIALIEARGHSTIAVYDSVFNEEGFKRPFRDLLQEYENRMRASRLWSYAWVELLRAGTSNTEVKATQTFFLRQHVARYVRLWRAYGSKLQEERLHMLGEYMNQLDIANFALQRESSPETRRFFGDVTKELFVTLGRLSGAKID